MTHDCSYPPITTPFHSEPNNSEPDNVVTLDQADFSGAAQSFPACRDLHAYWEALRGARQMPARSEFDPRGIEATLACSFVAEKVAPSVARIRVAGSVLSEALGMDVRGMPITAFFEPDSREALSEATRDLFANPSLAEIELTSRRSFRRKPIRARMLLLPMSDAEGQVSRMVGCLDIEGGLQGTPRRFKINAVHRTQVTGDAPITARTDNPYQHAVAMQNAPQTPEFAFGEAPSPFAAKPHSGVPDYKSERTKLTLIVDNG